YDDVLPTGEIGPVAGGAYDFGRPDGRPLGGLYLDDCFTDLAGPGPLAELRDPASGVGLRLSSPSAAIRALQVYAPPDEPFVVLEPQFNLADPYGAQWVGRDAGMQLLRPEQLHARVAPIPYGAQWVGRDAGMQLLRPGEQAAYAVRVQPFALRP